ESPGCRRDSVAGEAGEIRTVVVGLRDPRSLFSGGLRDARGRDQSRLSTWTLCRARELQQISGEAFGVSARAVEGAAGAGEPGAARDRMAAARGEGADFEIEGADSGCVRAAGSAGGCQFAEQERHDIDRLHRDRADDEATAHVRQNLEEHGRAVAVRESDVCAWPWREAGRARVEWQREVDAAADSGGGDWAGLG